MEDKQKDNSNQGKRFSLSNFGSFKLSKKEKTKEKVDEDEIKKLSQSFIDQCNVFKDKQNTPESTYTKFDRTAEGELITSLLMIICGLKNNQLEYALTSFTNVWQSRRYAVNVDDSHMQQAIQDFLQQNNDNLSKNPEKRNAIDKVLQVTRDQHTKFLEAKRLSLATQPSTSMEDSVQKKARVRADVIRTQIASAISDLKQYSNTLIYTEDQQTFNHFSPYPSQEYMDIILKHAMHYQGHYMCGADCLEEWLKQMKDTRILISYFQHSNILTGFSEYTQKKIKLLIDGQEGVIQPCPSASEYFDEYIKFACAVQPASYETIKNNAELAQKYLAKKLIDEQKSADEQTRRTTA